MKFNVNCLIRFQHCDPAGIVFYPRYFEMFHQVVEDWFANALQYNHPELFKNKIGIPLVSVSCNFFSAAHIGDTVEFDLTVKKIGNSSFTVIIAGNIADKLVLTAELVIALVSLGADMKAITIPDNIRAIMSDYMDC